MKNYVKLRIKPIIQKDSRIWKVSFIIIENFNWFFQGGFISQTWKGNENILHTNGWFNCLHIFKNATKDIFYFINLFLVAGKYISANNVTIHLECRYIYIIQYVL